MFCNGTSNSIEEREKGSRASVYLILYSEGEVPNCFLKALEKYA